MLLGEETGISGVANFTSLATRSWKRRSRSRLSLTWPCDVYSNRKMAG